jgi:hypothetical protein
LLSSKQFIQPFDKLKDKLVIQAQTRDMLEISNAFVNTKTKNSEIIESKSKNLIQKRCRIFFAKIISSEGHKLALRCAALQTQFWLFARSCRQVEVQLRPILTEEQLKDQQF